MRMPNATCGTNIQLKDQRPSSFILLCFDCLAKRLGRELRRADFDWTIPVNQGLRWNPKMPFNATYVHPLLNRIGPRDRKFKKLNEALSEYLKDIGEGTANCDVQSDQEHRIFEAAVEAFYGPEVWDKFINPLMEKCDT